MTAPTTLRARARRLIVISLVLVLAGAGAAAAYWTATAQLSTTASTAAVGLEQKILPSESETPLATTYTSEVAAAAGAFALTNTGSRAAEYTLSVDIASTSAATLPSTLQLAAGELTAGQECTSNTSLGTTGTGAETLRSTGTLEAGATVELCLRTTLPPEAAAAHVGAEITLSLSSSLRYAEGEAWTVTAGPATITQTVAPRDDAPEPPGGKNFVSDGARYTVRLDGACIQRTAMAGSRGLALQTACGESESQWRLTDMGDGTFTIDWATNQRPGALSQTRWTATGEGKSVMLTDRRDGDTAQRWRVTASGTDRYRFESVAHPGQFLTVGGGLWNSSDTSARHLTLEPAREGAAQSFGIDRVGNPFPFPERETMRADGAGPSYFGLTFTRNTGNGWSSGYDQEFSSRVFLAPEHAPEARVEHPVGKLTGEYTTVQFTPEVVRAYADSAQGGYGNSWVYVEQKLPGGTWTPVAVGKIHIEKTSQSIGVYPGWR